MAKAWRENLYFSYDKWIHNLISLQLGIMDEKVEVHSDMVWMDVDGELMRKRNTELCTSPIK